MADVAPPPPFRLYPLVDHVADKVAAMYERHNDRTSGRYRDLVDLVLIVGAEDIQLDNDLLERALRREQSRRGMTMPQRLVTPGPDWRIHFEREAARSPVPEELRSLDRALEFVGQVIDPILARIYPPGSHPTPTDPTHHPRPDR